MYSCGARHFADFGTILGGVRCIFFFTSTKFSFHPHRVQRITILGLSGIILPGSIFNLDTQRLQKWFDHLDGVLDKRSAAAERAHCFVFVNFRLA